MKFASPLWVRSAIAGAFSGIVNFATFLPLPTSLISSNVAADAVGSAEGDAAVAAVELPALAAAGVAGAPGLLVAELPPHPPSSAAAATSARMRLIGSGYAARQSQRRRRAVRDGQRAATRPSAGPSGAGLAACPENDGIDVAVQPVRRAPCRPSGDATTTTQGPPHVPGEQEGRDRLRPHGSPRARAAPGRAGSAPGR